MPDIDQSVGLQGVVVGSICFKRTYSHKKHDEQATHDLRPQRVLHDHYVILNTEVSDLAGLEIISRDVVAIQRIARFIVIITNPHEDRSAGDKVRISNLL